MSYESSLLKICKYRGWYPRVIGTIKEAGDAYPIWLIQTTLEKPDDYPSALVVSGFHGEEVAGPWGIIQWMQSTDLSHLKGINLSILPVVNPWGFYHNQRYGPSKLATNTGFYRPNEKPSPEGYILQKNIDVLRPLANGGYLSLHEDITSSLYYLYTFEQSELPGKFTEEMKSVLSKHFLKPYDGIAYVDTTSPGAGPPCKDGLVWKFFDGSFDDWMFQLGVPRVVVTETPGSYPFHSRVSADVDIINKFIDLVKRGV